VVQTIVEIKRINEYNLITLLIILGACFTSFLVFIVCINTCKQTS